jgi:hypothetical protein
LPENILPQNSPDQGVIVAKVTHAAEESTAEYRHYSVEMHGEEPKHHNVVVNFLYDHVTDATGLPKEGDRYLISYKRLSP